MTLPLRCPFVVQPQQLTACRLLHSLICRKQNRRSLWELAFAGVILLLLFVVLNRPYKLKYMLITCNK